MNSKKSQRKLLALAVVAAMGSTFALSVAAQEAAPPGETGTQETRGRSSRSPSALWLAFWLAVVLIGTKGFYLGWRAADPPSDWLSYVGSLAAISIARSSTICAPTAMSR